MKTQPRIVKILKAECHAHGVTLIGDQRTVHFSYRSHAFTPEIRQYGERRTTQHETQPFNGVPLHPFTLTRRIR